MLGAAVAQSPESPPGVGADEEEDELCEHT